MKKERTHHDSESERLHMTDSFWSKNPDPRLNACSTIWAFLEGADPRKEVWEPLPSSHLIHSSLPDPAMTNQAGRDRSWAGIAVVIGQSSIEEPRGPQ